MLTNESTPYTAETMIMGIAPSSEFALIALQIYYHQYFQEQYQEVQDPA